MVDRYFADVSLAALYDAFNRPDLRDDFKFYLPMIIAARSVLDVGCGTGAMLHMARDGGHKGRLCGLDPGEGMIEAARATPSDIEWMVGDLTSVDWRNEFDLAVMTGHAFQALVEDEDIRSSLAAMRTLLTAEGCFAFETRNPTSQVWENWTSRRPAEIRDAAGQTIQMVRKVEKAFDGKTLSFSHTFTSYAWDVPRVSHSTLRFLDADTLNSFLGEAGFEVAEQFGDWDRSPVRASSPEIITLARRRT
ncbi:MAG: methyltransferase domain-containing protein [Gammaproteobacteria bacterium]|nr:methyltransferase domain-containing protein [Gammaproteobacteria bacterium]